VQVGEGINDAPALAAATVGVVVADCASATSLEVADVLLLGSSAGISNLPFLTYKVTLILIAKGGTVRSPIHRGSDRLWFPTFLHHHISRIGSKASRPSRENGDNTNS